MPSQLGLLIHLSHHCLHLHMVFLPLNLCLSIFKTPFYYKHTNHWIKAPSYYDTNLTVIDYLYKASVAILENFLLAQGIRGITVCFLPRNIITVWLLALSFKEHKVSGIAFFFFFFILVSIYWVPVLHKVPDHRLKRWSRYPCCLQRNFMFKELIDS